MYGKNKEWLRKVAIYILAGLIIVFTLIYVSYDSAGAKEDGNNITIKPETFSQEYRNSKGEVRLQLVYQYPNISGEYEGIDKVNCRYTTLFCDWLKSQDELIDSVSEEEGRVGSKYANEVSYTITYNKNKILSTLFEGYAYTGGAHGVPYRTPTNLSLDTGEDVDLKKLLNKSEDEIKKALNDSFSKKFDANKSDYWENAKDIVSNTKYEDLRYYLTEEGVTFYFDPYILAPYAAGFVETTINY